MQAVILAAGRGTRMRPLSDSRPKPMLPVADRPLLAHVADAAVDAGIDELVFVVGYEAAAVREHFGDRYRDVPVEYVEQDSADGTADAVHRAAPALEGDFVVLNGDNLCTAADVDALVERAPSVAAYEVDRPSNYGVLATDGGSVTNVVEKPSDPQTSLANAGAYAFPGRALDWLDVEASERGERELTDVLASVADAYEVTPVEFDRWLDVGRPWELLAANERRVGRLDRRLDGDVHEDATVRGDVVVEAGATVDAGSVIEGPALVREGASVGPNAYVRGTTLVGPGAEVGHGVEVKNSVLMAGASVSHLSYVGDSVLGRDVNFGAGTNVANLRHDDQPVRVRVKGESVSTGRRKFGVVVGDGAKTGINTSLNAGVTLSEGATTTPGETVTRDR
ncbi:bifunctional sugar-1-phosphate nucleotidylyltransferase/acetyltransferase [Halobacterium yunchengense]|uniref:bifunctional sugar-1-phosphate nucleotidylyltransferase/acetyltransferase n=1 Tax=Halobacterium yunchengense TaxID=3108497 RepID=UPI00300B25ED